MDNALKSKKILTYDDVAKFPAGTSDEPMVDVNAFDDSILTEYKKFDMLPIVGNMIYVRETLALKLAKIQKELNEEGYRLKVVYGYRHPDVQRHYFETRRETLKAQNSNMSEEMLDRYTHNFVAIPEIAGHPAGAAVDVTIVRDDTSEIDMGTDIADYSDENMIKTFADSLTNKQEENRLKLHDLMVGEGFAPFYGEWWHFSYGDREWAAFYNKKALYGAIDFRIV